VKSLGTEKFWEVYRALPPGIKEAARAVAQRFEVDVWVWAWIGSHKEFDRQFPT
jgi:hypothetical protein